MSKLQNNLLSEGLRRSFGGETNIKKIKRGEFQLTSSHYKQDNGATYHDEWVTGGGQELVRNANGEAFTRTYVGNVISPAVLESMGIIEKDVITFLTRIVQEHGNQIRFDANFKTIFEDWKYSYKVTYKCEDPFIINGIEKIYFKGNLVFVHTYGISKVIES